MQSDTGGKYNKDGESRGEPSPARRLVCLRSGDYLGVEGRPVEVQVDLCQRGDGSFNIVGLPGKSTRESRDRSVSGLKRSGDLFLCRFWYSGILNRVKLSQSQSRGGPLSLLRI